MYVTLYKSQKRKNSGDRKDTNPATKTYPSFGTAAFTPVLNDLSSIFYTQYLNLNPNRKKKINKFKEQKNMLNSPFKVQSLRREIEIRIHLRHSFGSHISHHRNPLHRRSNLAPPSPRRRRPIPADDLVKRRITRFISWP